MIMEKTGIICMIGDLSDFEIELNKLNIKYSATVHKGGVVSIACEAEQSVIGPLTERVTKQIHIKSNQKKWN